MEARRKVFLDGVNLTPEGLVDIGYDMTVEVGITPAAWRRVRQGREVVRKVLKRNEISYGINTGFGNFASVIIPDDKLAELQGNLIRSHSAGVGAPLSPQQTRMLLALRINVLAKGHSGIRVRTLHQLLSALNVNCLPRVPSKGTVGASGDLAPLSHLALGLMGEGLCWHPTLKTFQPAQEVLLEFGLEPLKLRAKEGLALINGTQLICSIGAEALTRAKQVARAADVVAALTLEALRGSATPFHPFIHQARPHKGQELVAGRLRYLLNFGGSPSEITSSHKACGKVQDSYTIRCIPQVHGIVHDTIEFVNEVLTTECNSATDNPMIFVASKEEMAFFNREPRIVRPEAVDSKHKWEDGIIMSGGNFHGEYPAKIMDYLAIAIHEIASISERRIERLVNPSLSQLPAFLTKDGGLNSGFMIAHCTAAALVSENKTLCHPASVDSLSTSAAQEDHVSMGGFAARKALTVVEHVEYCVAIELLAATQAIDFLRPLHTTAPLEAIYRLVRTKVPKWENDRYMAPDIEACVKLVREGKIWETVLPYMSPKYHNFHCLKSISPTEAKEQFLKVQALHKKDQIINFPHTADSPTSSSFPLLSKL